MIQVHVCDSSTLVLFFRIEEALERSYAIIMEFHLRVTLQSKVVLADYSATVAIDDTKLQYCNCMVLN